MLVVSPGTVKQRIGTANQHNGARSLSRNGAAVAREAGANHRQEQPAYHRRSGMKFYGHPPAVSPAT